VSSSLCLLFGVFSPVSSLCLLFHLPFISLLSIPPLFFLF
jgi:hypothetical protein